MIKRAFLVLRIVAAWGLLVFLVALLYSAIPVIGRFEFPIVLLATATMSLVVTGAFSHLGRVSLIAGRVDSGTLSNRQRRQVEIPFEAGEAFDLLDAASDWALRRVPRMHARP